MEVRGQQPGGADDARQRFREVSARLSHANRARLRRAREVLQTLSEQRLTHRRAVNQRAAEQNRSQGEEAVQGKSKAASEQHSVERTQRAPEPEALQASQRAEQVRADIAARVKKQDRLELSEAARAASSGPDEARIAKVKELKALHQAGNLNTPERIETAAERLLET